MALKRMKVNLDRVLDKNMQDIVRGIRNHKDNESKYIADCLDEIKQELRSDNLGSKANAISKLVYLEMLGYDISWAAFNVIEVMSSTKFTYKRTGYLAASQSFHAGTDVLMLATNMIRKDLSSSSMYDAGVALSGLSCFISPDLAQDLANDIMSLMMSTRPYLRKKAILLMYKVYLNYPDALRPSFPKLKERLEDPDPGVQSAAVNVICELARKNPKNYLSLAPTFFKLMTNSSNNWMLIKIIKLFGALTPLEPRLGKKLIEPLTNLIHSTSAMSLLYECINTVIAVLVSISTELPNHTASIQLCVQKLRVLIEDSDQNLKYLGLLAMSKILKSHPKSVQAHKDLVLQCLDDRDESIRLRALDLLYGMVSKKNLMEIVKKLMVHMEHAEGTIYRDELMAKIIEICAQSNYQFVVNFEWYVSVLVELTKIHSTQHGRLLADQMMDVAIRVAAIREFAVQQMAILLNNSHMFAHNSHKNGICEILYAAAWICGEFSEYLKDPFATLTSMFKSKVTSLPGHIQSVYVQNITKLYSAILVKAELAGDHEKIGRVGQLLVNQLPMFAQSGDLEVQERACSALQLIKYITKLLDKGVAVGDEVSFLFAGDLNPVAPKAQRKVPIPEGLDLDKWINAPPSKPVDLSKKKSIFGKEGTSSFYGDEKKPSSKKAKEISAEELRKQREARLQEQAANPNYLKLGGPTSKSSTVSVNAESINVDDIPIESLQLDVDLEMHSGLDGLASSDKYYVASKAEAFANKKKKRGKDRKGKKGKKSRRDDYDSDEDIQPIHAVSAIIDMPEGVVLGDSDDDNDLKKEEAFRALDINLDEPLRDDEKLPVRQHRAALPEPVESSAATTEKKKKRKDKESKKKKSSKKVETPVASTSQELIDALGLSGATSTDPAFATDTKFLNGDNDNEAPRKVKKDRGTKEKKKKSSKSSKKDRSEYEIAEGVATPSKENMSGRGTPSANLELASIPLSRYRNLASDNYLKLAFEPRVSNGQPNTLVVSAVFTNLSTTSALKSIDFNVLDSMNAKLIRQNEGEAVKVQFELLPNLANETQFVFNVKSLSMPQKLKGTVTYIVKTDDGATQQKLDFRLIVNCRDFLVASHCDRESFADLLTGGKLEAKCSKQFSCADSEFTTVLTKVCFHANMFVVEQIAKSASLYAQSIQGHHTCLLVKQQANDYISIDGKCSDSVFLGTVIDEIQDVLTN